MLQSILSRHMLGGLCDNQTAKLVRFQWDIKDAIASKSKTRPQNKYHLQIHRQSARHINQLMHLQNITSIVWSFGLLYISTTERSLKNYLHFVIFVGCLVHVLFCTGNYFHAKQLTIINMWTIIIYCLQKMLDAILWISFTIKFNFLTHGL